MITSACSTGVILRCPRAARASKDAARVPGPSPQRNRIYPISHFQMSKSAIADLVGSLCSHLTVTEQNLARHRHDLAHRHVDEARHGARGDDGVLLRVGLVVLL